MKYYQYNENGVLSDIGVAQYDDGSNYYLDDAVVSATKYPILVNGSVVCDVDKYRAERINELFSFLQLSEKDIILKSKDLPEIASLKDVLYSVFFGKRNELTAAQSQADIDKVVW